MTAKTMTKTHLAIVRFRFRSIQPILQTKKDTTHSKQQQSLRIYYIFYLRCAHAALLRPFVFCVFISCVSEARAHTHTHTYTPIFVRRQPELSACCCLSNTCFNQTLRKAVYAGM